MTIDHAHPGGEAVGQLKHRSPWEVALIVGLRHWCDGPLGQATIQSDFSLALSESAAQRVYASFDQLLRLILQHAHRPLVRHDIDCPCCGADEAVFAQLVRTATSGDLHDAALMATLLAGPAKAELIAILAGEVGSAMQRMTENHAPLGTLPAQQRAGLH